MMEEASYGGGSGCFPRKTCFNMQGGDTSGQPHKKRKAHAKSTSGLPFSKKRWDTGWGFRLAHASPERKKRQALSPHRNTVYRPKAHLTRMCSFSLGPPLEKHTWICSVKLIACPQKHYTEGTPFSDPRALHFLQRFWL